MGNAQLAAILTERPEIDLFLAGIAADLTRQGRTV